MAESFSLGHILCSGAVSRVIVWPWLEEHNELQTCCQQHIYMYKRVRNPVHETFAGKTNAGMFTCTMSTFSILHVAMSSRPTQHKTKTPHSYVPLKHRYNYVVVGIVTKCKHRFECVFVFVEKHLRIMLAR